MTVMTPEWERVLKEDDLCSVYNYSCRKAIGDECLGLMADEFPQLYID